MDEPLSNLDAKLRASVRKDIKKLQVDLGITVIYVTHDQTEAMSMADMVVLMSDGHIQQVGAPADLYYRPANTFVAEFVGLRSEEHTSELQSLMRISYAVFCLKKNKKINNYIQDIIRRPQNTNT